MPRENPDKSRPPISAPMKSSYVLQMNWWHFSDENRLKWLRIHGEALATAQKSVEAEIHRLERHINYRKNPPPALLITPGLDLRI